MKAYLSQEEGTVCFVFRRAKSLKLSQLCDPVDIALEFTQARILGGLPCSVFLTQALEENRGWVGETVVLYFLSVRSGGCRGFGWRKERLCLVSEERWRLGVRCPGSV